METERKIKVAIKLKNSELKEAKRIGNKCACDVTLEENKFWEKMKTRCLLSVISSEDLEAIN
jgi:hypothetical protein